MDARVATCPDWSLSDLVEHLGNVHWFFGTIAERRLQDPGEVGERPAPGTGEALAGWAREQGERIVRVLSGADPAEAVWTWAPPHDMSFIIRRMTHETAVHRVDAETTTPGGPGAIDASLALDGIDEFLTLFLPRALREHGPLGVSVHLHCTDAAGEWLIRPDGSWIEGHEKGDAAIRGAASDLLLGLWRRVPLDALDVVGDRDAAERLIAAIAV
jgi:uncharacterized protein (TIGR03083 family)